MQMKIDEIGVDMYRLSVFVPEVATPAEACLFNTDRRKLTEKLY